MESRGKVLVVDDDGRLVDALTLYLEHAGFEVRTAADGLQALEVFARYAPDIVVLDIMMPVLNGWDTCRRLREISPVPIIMLTARGQENDRIMGLQLGADDYVSKPFSLRELEARLDAVLRRTRKTQDTASRCLYDDGHLFIDVSGWEVSRDGQPVDLTATERLLLLYLVENMSVARSSEQILDRVWGAQYRGQNEYVKLYIWRLRQKIETDPANPQYIVTERGQGYRFAPQDGARRR
ncbi:MAG: response regulator transcription factor [Anaerolineae bacterium]